MYEGFVDEFAVVSHAPIFTIDVESDEVASDGGVIGLVHGMRGEVFARHGWVVVVAVDVEFFEALKGLLRELVEIDAKTFSFGCSRGVAFEPHSHFVQGVFVVVDEHGRVAVVGIPIFFEQHLVQ